MEEIRAYRNGMLGLGLPPYSSHAMEFRSNGRPDVAARREHAA